MNVSNVHMTNDWKCDSEAKTSYNRLLQKYETGGLEAPTNDCLAIARDHYCFNSFRRCRDSEMVSVLLVV